MSATVLKAFLDGLEESPETVTRESLDLLVEEGFLDYDGAERLGADPRFWVLTKWNPVDARDVEGDELSIDLLPPNRIRWTRLTRAGGSAEPFDWSSVEVLRD